MRVCPSVRPYVRLHLNETAENDDFSLENHIMAHFGRILLPARACYRKIECRFFVMKENLYFKDKQQNQHDGMEQ